MNTDLLLLKTYFGFTSIINPDKAARQSFRLFQKVQKKNIREREEHFFALSRPFKIHSSVGTIDCFEMGNPVGDLVILVHGWDSNAGSMAMLAHTLVKKDKRVISFNLPGHAFYKSRHTNLIECKEAFLALIEFLNPTGPFSIIAHSFGSAVCTYALAKSNYPIDQLVLLTNPNKLETIFKDFKKGIGLGNKAYLRLLKITLDRLGEPISAISVQENLKRISYKRLLLIHDKYDRVLPYKHSTEINNEIENSQLITLENVGHYKMLWNQEVIGRSVAFVDGREVM